MGFDDGACVLVLGGVAKKMGGPVWRKVVWVLIGILAFVYSQLLGIFLISMPWIGLIVFVMLVLSTIAMAMTGKQKKRGSEIFAFSRSGFSRWTVGSKPSSRDFVVWEGTNPAAIVKRVSGVWASLKIVSFDEQGRRIIPIECGFRCRVEDIGWVQNILGKLVAGERIESQKNSPDENKEMPPSIPLV